MKTKQVNIPLYHVEKIGFPFIEGSFVCKTGKVLHGFFLIDSGSHSNVFNYEAVHTLDESWFRDTQNKLTAIDNEGELCQVVDISINVGDNESSELFSVSKNLDFTQYFGKNNIIGILGTEFMHKHNLVLDYESKTVHTSTIDDFKMENKQFAFPMGFGFKAFGIPVVGFEKNGEEFICVADSGCNFSTLTKYAMEHGALSYVHNPKNCSSVSGVSGSFETSEAQVSIALISLSEQEGEVCGLPHTDEFHITSDRKTLTQSEGEDVPPISGLLSTPFMLKRKWILDFSIGVIYSNAA